MFDQALTQIPDAHRHGTNVLVRTDSTGSAKAVLDTFVVGVDDRTPIAAAEPYAPLPAAQAVDRVP